MTVKTREKVDITTVFIFIISLLLIIISDKIKLGMNKDCRGKGETERRDVHRGKKHTQLCQCCLGSRS
jgi:hypothetical protein